MLRLFLWCLCIGLPALADGSQGFDASGTSSASIQRIQMLHDPDSVLDIREVVTAVSEGEFEDVEPARSAGPRKGTVWLRLTVWGGHDANANISRWLLLNSPLLLEAQLFHCGEFGCEANTTTGLLHPLESRDLPTRLPVFAISPKAGLTEVYFVRMKSDVVVWIDPHLLSPAKLVARAQQQQLLLGLLIACHALLMASSLWFAWHARDRSHVWLATLIGTNLLFSLGMESGLLQVLLADRLEWFMPMMAALWTIRVPLVGAFALAHLRADRFPMARAYLLMLATVGLADWLLSLQGGPQIWARWTQGWAIAQLFLLALLAAHSARRGLRGSWVLTLALLPPLLGALYSRIAMQSGEPLTFGTQHALPLGYAGFLLVMQYAPIRRYRDLRLAYAHSQSRALARSRKAQRQLEERVVARTRELEAALSMARLAVATEAQAREEQRQFFLTMQHELRTPLAVINAANKNLLHDLPADAESSRLRCQRIDRAVEQLNSVLNRSLQARQLEKSTSMMHPEQTTLRTLLLEAHDAARLLSNDHVLILKLDDLPEQWNCDHALTALALRTLAVNAVRYTPAGTRITILGYVDARGLYLEVEDDGPGVSTEDLPHLFERYFRGGNAVGIPGTGMGLPLARRMIELQDGWLDVESSQGEGFKATIWLPRRPYSAPPLVPA